MVFSGGLPILLPIAGVNFLILGVSDRYFLLRAGQQPPSYDARLAVFFKKAMVLALVMHVSVTSYMFSSRVENDSEIRIMRSSNVTNTGIERLFGEEGSKGRLFYDDRIAWR